MSQVRPRRSLRLEDAPAGPRRVHACARVSLYSPPRTCACEGGSVGGRRLWRTGHDHEERRREIKSRRMQTQIDCKNIIIERQGARTSKSEREEARRNEMAEETRGVEREKQKTLPHARRRRALCLKASCSPSRRLFKRPGHKGTKTRPRSRPAPGPNVSRPVGNLWPARTRPLCLRESQPGPHGQSLPLRSRYHFTSRRETRGAGKEDRVKFRHCPVP